MEKSIFTLLVEPRGDLYSEILDFAVGECKVALLVNRVQLKMAKHGTDVLDQLKPFLKNAVESAEWPGTELFSGETAMVYRYVFGPECADILKRVANSFYDWTQPEFPEDLCLLKDDETPWLVSIAHEKDSYFCLSQDEKNRLLDSIPRLASILSKENQE
jgi:hypothetical protein